MLILILIGIVPSMITAYLVVRSYEERAVSLRMVNVRNQCEILCNSLVAEQYFSNPGSEVINSQLNLLSNIYSGRILIVDSDFRVVHDTFDLDTGRTSVTREVMTAGMPILRSPFPSRRRARTMPTACCWRRSPPTRSSRASACWRTAASP